MDTMLDIAKVVIPLILALPSAIKNTLDVVDRIRERRKADEDDD